MPSERSGWLCHGKGSRIDEVTSFHGKWPLLGILVSYCPAPGLTQRDAQGCWCGTGNGNGHMQGKCLDLWTPEACDAEFSPPAWASFLPPSALPGASYVVSSASGTYTVL